MSILSNGAFLAIFAQALIGISLIWDKIQLRQPETKSLPNYVFWMGAISIFGLVLVFFGFRWPPARTAALGFAAGALDLLATWFYYRALKQGEASQALAVAGGFSPLATALIGAGLLAKPLGGASVSGFALLVAGGFVMFASENLNWRRVLPSAVIAATLFGLTNVLQKIVFDAAGFISGFAFVTLGTFAGAMSLLLRPCWRRQIFEQSENASTPKRFWYFFNRVLAGVGSFLIFYAISKASPVIVDGISGVRYAVVFLGAWLLTKVRPAWLKEDFRGTALIGKSAATALIAAGLVLIAMNSPAANGSASANAPSRRSGRLTMDTIPEVWRTRIASLRPAASRAGTSLRRRRPRRS